MDLSGVLSSALAASLDIVKDVEVVLAKNESLVAEGVDLVGILISDEAFKGHLGALIAAVKK